VHALVPLRFLLFLGALLVFVNLAPNTWQIRIKPRIWHGMATGIVGAIAVMTISQPHPFIYFQF
jgi:hypothetical protein